MTEDSRFLNILSVINVHRHRLSFSVLIIVTIGYILVTRNTVTIHDI